MSVEMTIVLFALVAFTIEIVVLALVVRGHVWRLQAIDDELARLHRRLAAVSDAVAGIITRMR